MLTAKHWVQMNVVDWSHYVVCTPEPFHIQANIWKTEIEKNPYNKYSLLFVANSNTKTAFSCMVLATTTIRCVNRCSKPGTLSAFNRTSLRVTEVNGILMLSFTWALLNSKLLRKSITITLSGLSVSNLTKSFALIRGHRSYCKFCNSIPLTSCVDKRAHIEH